MTREVIATLDLDDAPALAGQKRLGAGFQVLEGGSQKTARAFGSHWSESDKQVSGVLGHLEGRFFSLRHIAAATLGAFTIGSAILGIKTFLGQLITSLDITNQIGNSFQAIKQTLFDSAAAIPGLANFFSKTLPDFILRLAATLDLAWQNLKNLISHPLSYEKLGGGALDKLFKKMKDIRERITVEEFLGLPKPEEIKKFHALFEEAVRFLDNAFIKGTINADRYIKSLNKIVDAALGAGNLTDALFAASNGMIVLTQKMGLHREAVGRLHDEYLKLRDAMMAAGASPDQLHRFDEINKSLIFAAAKADILKLSFEAMGQVMTSALVSWAEGGVLSLRKFFSSLLIMVGQSLLAYGALAIVKGYFTYNKEEIAVGLVAIGAGIAALAAARAIGGGATSAGRSGSGGGAAAGVSGGSGQTGASQVFNFTFEGPVLGGSTDALMRTITMGVKKALKDGVGGGTLDFSTEPI